MTRRIVAILLALLLSLGAVSAMGAEEKLEDYPWAASIAAKKDENLVDMDKNLDITWWGLNIGGILPKDNTIMEQLVEQRFNITVTNVKVDYTNKEQVSLLQSLGTHYDVCTYAYNFAELAEQGIIREVDPELIRTYAPTITKYLEETAGEDWVKLCEYDGKYWGIPNITPSNGTPNVMGIRTDWLKAIGYDESNLPTTLEGIEEMLVKLRTKDPDGNGKDDTYALGANNSYGMYEFGTYGMSKSYWYHDEDGTLMTYVIDPDYKNVLKLMKRWYELGIYDPEIITDSRANGIAKYANGIIAGYTSLDNAFSPLSAGTVSGPGAARTNGNDIPVTIIPPAEGLYTTQYNTTASTSGTTFGYNCPDEKLIRILQMEDTFFADRDLWLVDGYGEKGLHWDYNEAGIAAQGSANGFVDKVREDWGYNHFYNHAFIPRDFMGLRMGGEGIPGSRYEIYQQVKDYAMIPIATEQSFKTEADIEYGASVSKIADEYFLKAITGAVDIDATFDAHVQQWLDAGGQEIVDAKRAMFAN